MVEDTPHGEEASNEKWEHTAEKVGNKQGQESEANPGTKSEENQIIPAPGAPTQGNPIDGTRNGPNPAQNRVACENCGLFNHVTRVCRKVLCEICGFNNHTAYDCKRCVSWNTSPELCAAQVEDRSFFFIEELIDPRVSREKESIAVISIVQGHATGKQIEQQFMHVAGSSTWKWNARQVGENRFVMRFPNAKLVFDWSQFEALTMKEANAQMKVEQWSPKFGASTSLVQSGGYSC